MAHLLSAVRHEDTIKSCRLSPDGKLLLTASADGTARLWDAESGAPKNNIIFRHDGEVLAANFSHDATLIVTAGKDGTARIWSSSDGSEVTPALQHDDDVRIADVLFLRGGRQCKVVADQPRDGARLVPAHAVFEAEGFGIDRPEFRMIAAATFGDIMEQAGQVRDFRFLQRLHDPAAVREFVIEPGQCESPQVTDHEQGVFVHGVGVEQVVLHPADDTAE